MPNPTAPKTSSTVVIVPVTAQTTAEPMKGAVHGVESTAVMMPKPKEPITVSCRGSIM